jgi:uncharacterized RDD family membrane protein YckC
MDGSSVGEIVPMDKAMTQTKPKINFGWHDGIPDALADDGYFAGIRSRRVFAYLIDVLIIGLLLVALWTIGLIFTVMTFGLLFPVLATLSAILPLIYHTITIGGAGRGTWGMRAMDLRAYSVDGARPNYVQALVFAFGFYLTVSFTTFLVLLVALFNARGRLVHDYVSGLVVARSENPYQS